MSRFRRNRHIVRMAKKLPTDFGEEPKKDWPQRAQNTAWPVPATKGNR